MKKGLVVGIVLVMMCLFVGCSKKEEEPKGRIQTLTVEEAITMIENNENFAVFVGQSTCTHCAQYKEDLTTYMKDHALIMYYIEADAEENEDTFDDFIDLYMPDIEYTPTTYYFKDGVATQDVVGEMTVDQIEIWVNRCGIDVD